MTTPTTLADLHQRYDGPIPEAARRAALGPTPTLLTATRDFGEAQGRIAAIREILWQGKFDAPTLASMMRAARENMLRAHDQIEALQQLDSVDATRS